MALQVTLQPRYSIDPQRIGDALAARLLRDYSGDEVQALSRDGVERYARQEYISLCTYFGLPSTATDDIVRAVWKRVAEAQGVDEETGNPQFEFYS